MRHPPDDRGNSAASFEAQWRERFQEFAQLRDDDAGIAGWSRSGLDARFRFFRARWSPPGARTRWLDVGCGAGTYAGWLAEQDLDVVGLDYSAPTLTKARARLAARIALCAGDAMHLPFADGAFDGALCFGVLQAVSDAASVVREIARVLKPGAVLWIDALNRQELAARLSETRRRLKRKRRHLRYDAAEPLARLIRDAGFTNVRTHWLPIAPSSLRPLQPMLESRIAVWVLSHVPLAGPLFAHSVLFEARRAR